MIDRVLALAICVELIPRTGRCLATLWAFVMHIAPKPRGLDLLGFELALQLDRGVIGKEAGARPDQLADIFGQWLQ